MSVLEKLVLLICGKHIFTILLNLSSDNTNKPYVGHFLLNTDYESVIFRRCDIAGLKATKCGKAYAVLE